MQNKTLEPCSAEQTAGREALLRNKITLLSFLFSMFVIWIHTLNIEVYGLQQGEGDLGGFVWALESLWQSLVCSAVPGFFLLSGFLFFRTYSWSKTLEKYRSRLHSIVIPYFIWALVNYLYLVLLTHLPFIAGHMNSPPYPFSPAQLLRALWPDVKGGLWFLRNLIIFIAVSPLLYLLLKNRSPLPTGLLVLAVLLGNSLFNWFPFPRGLELYATGAYIAINHKGAEYRQSRRLSLFGAAAAAVMFFAGVISVHDLSAIPFCFALWFLLDLFVRETALPWWMKITFFTFVTHTMLLEPLEKLFLLLFGRAPVFALLDYLFMPPLVLLILALIAKQLKKAPRLWAVLCGGR